MIPTKTYPLSAIMGESTIASCAACGQPMHPIDLVARQQERIAQLEARLKHCEGHAAELEAEVMAWRERLGLAVAALIEISNINPNGDAEHARIARETIAQIEEGK